MIAPISDYYGYTAWPESGSNLDLSVSLYSAAGGLLASSNPMGLAATLVTSNLSAGTYFLSLDGVGYGDPTSSSPTGYADYCSLGNYWISGSIVNAADNTGPTPPGSGTPVVTPGLTISDVSQREGTGTSPTLVQVSVNLSMAIASDVSVDFSSVDGSAISTGTSRDYTPVTGTLKIAAGSTSATISLAVNADSVVEADEQLFINLSNAVGADLIDQQAMVTILNDDSLTKKRGPAKILADSSVNPSAVAAARRSDPITGQPMDDHPGWEALWASAPSPAPHQINPLGHGPAPFWDLADSSLSNQAPVGFVASDPIMPIGLPSPSSLPFAAADSSQLSSQLLI